jgi:hypothetical protein
MCSHATIEVSFSGEFLFRKKKRAAPYKMKKSKKSIINKAADFTTDFTTDSFSGAVSKERRSSLLRSSLSSLTLSPPSTFLSPEVLPHLKKEKNIKIKNKKSTAPPSSAPLPLPPYPLLATHFSVS